MGYLAFASAASQARVILTDSGGLQKEAYWYGVPCVTMRPSTEWVATIEVGANVLVDDDPEAIVAAVRAARSRRRAGALRRRPREREGRRDAAAPVTADVPGWDAGTIRRCDDARHSLGDETTPIGSFESRSSAQGMSACPSRRCSPRAARSSWSMWTRTASRAQPRRELHRGRPVAEPRRARRSSRPPRDHRLRHAPRDGRDPDRTADPALPSARARPRDRALRRRRSPPGSARDTWSSWSRPPTPARRARRSSRSSRRGSGLVAGRDFHLAFSPERVDPGRTDHTTKTVPKVVGGIDEGSTERCGRALRQRDRHHPPRLLARGGRADEAPGEHLPLGQHRARQRARTALRPDGDRHLGGRGRGGDQAVRVHAVLARAGPRRALHPDRSLLPHLEGARVRLLDRFIELAGKVNPEMPYYCRRASRRR